MDKAAKERPIIHWRIECGPIDRTELLGIRTSLLNRRPFLQRPRIQPLGIQTDPLTW